MRFTCAKLAKLQLPGYPTSRQGWDKLVKDKAWSFEEFSGKGRGGVRREYTPPPDVMALIEAKGRGELPDVIVSLPRNVRPPKQVPFSLSDDVRSQLEQHKKWIEPIAQVAFIVRSIPQLADESERVLQSLVAMAWSYIFLEFNADLFQIGGFMADTSHIADRVLMFYGGVLAERERAGPKLDDEEIEALLKRQP